MSHPSVARSLVLETTLFPEDVSLDLSLIHICRCRR